MTLAHDVFRVALMAEAIVVLAGCEGAGGGDIDPANTVDRRFAIDTLDTYGWVEGPTNRVFGLPLHGALSVEGTLYVLDTGLDHVRVMTDGFRHLLDFSGSGPGPSELQSPFAIGALSGGRVIVADRGNTFKIFSVSEDSAVLESTFALDIKAEDFCVLNDELFVYGWDEAALIHNVSIDGDLLRAFGEGWESDSYLTRQERSEGIIGCHDQADVIATMFDLDPRVYGYTREGEQIWVSTIPDYHQARIEESTSASGKPRITLYDDPPHDMAAKIVPFGKDQFLLQLGLITTTDGSRSTKFRMYLVSAQDGTIRAIPGDVPLLLAASAPQIVTADIMPYPRLVLLELRERSQ